MTIKDKLQIYLITYNRKKHLQRTLESIFADNSPIKDFDITILDNASTDGTSELITEYCAKYPNLVHIRHEVNIGGNANICRAFEMGASCGKDYFWVLCDDDKYDFSNWSEVEQNIEDRKDIICVSDYVFKSSEGKISPAYQLFQLTFVPAGIYKASIITGEVLTVMYENTYTMFQQAVPVINTINKNGKIEVLNKPIVFNGLHFEDKTDDVSYTRGGTDSFITERKRNNVWVLGYSNIITLLKDKKLQRNCIQSVIIYKDIYGSWDNFYNSFVLGNMSKNKLNYILEVYEHLDFSKKMMIIYKIIKHFVLFRFIHIRINSEEIVLKLFNKLKIRVFAKKWFIKTQEKEIHAETNL